MMMHVTCIHRHHQQDPTHTHTRARARTRRGTHASMRTRARRGFGAQHQGARGAGAAAADGHVGGAGAATTRRRPRRAAAQAHGVVAGSATPDLLFAHAGQDDVARRVHFKRQFVVAGHNARLEDLVPAACGLERAVHVVACMRMRMRATVPRCVVWLVFVA